MYISRRAQNFLPRNLNWPIGEQCRATFLRSVAFLIFRFAKQARNRGDIMASVRETFVFPATVSPDCHHKSYRCSYANLPCIPRESRLSCPAINDKWTLFSLFKNSSILYTLYFILSFGLKYIFESYPRGYKEYLPTKVNVFYDSYFTFVILLRSLIFILHKLE